MLTCDLGGLWNGYANELTGGDREAIRRRRGEVVPLGQMGDAWDVAYAALFRASEEAKYVTGAEFVVDDCVSGHRSVATALWATGRILRSKIGLMGAATCQSNRNQQ
jgi:hypothetical protein